MLRRHLNNPQGQTTLQISCLQPIPSGSKDVLGLTETLQPGSPKVCYKYDSYVITTIYNHYDYNSFIMIILLWESAPQSSPFWPIFASDMLPAVTEEQSCQWIGIECHCSGLIPNQRIVRIQFLKRYEMSSWTDSTILYHHFAPRHLCLAVGCVDGVNTAFTMA